MGCCSALSLFSSFGERVPGVKIAPMRTTTCPRGQYHACLSKSHSLKLNRSSFPRSHDIHRKKMTSLNHSWILRFTGNNYISVWKHVLYIRQRSKQTWFLWYPGLSIKVCKVNKNLGFVSHPIICSKTFYVTLSKWRQVVSREGFTLKVKSRDAMSRDAMHLFYRCVLWCHIMILASNIRGTAFTSTFQIHLCK